MYEQSISAQHCSILSAYMLLRRGGQRQISQSEWNSCCHLIFSNENHDVCIRNISPVASSGISNLVELAVING